MPARSGAEACATVEALIAAATGQARTGLRSDVLLRAVHRRMQAHGLTSLQAYLHLASAGAAGRAELQRLTAELTVGETCFFRHRAQFDALRDHVLPQCIADNAARRRLRIWSAGCANGAEPYSIAILVHAALGARMADWDVRIVGSDINPTFLAQARRGLFTEWSLRDVPPERRAAHFVRRGENWQIRDRYRFAVDLVHHNLAGEAPLPGEGPGAFDIVFCRNVMIYLDDDANRALAERLHRALDDAGWLFVAPADLNPDLDALFAAQRFADAFVHRKRPLQSRRLGQADSRPAIGEAASLRGEVRADAPTLRHVRSAQAAAEGKGRQQAAAGIRQDRAPLAEAALQAVIECADKGDWPTASRHCEALIARDCCNAPAHYYHALVKHNCGARAEAEAGLRRAIYIDRGFALAHFQLALLRKEMRDVDGCRRWLHNAIAALSGIPDESSVSPCGGVTARELRELACRQLHCLERL